MPAPSAPADRSRPRNLRSGRLRRLGARAGAIAVVAAALTVPTGANGLGPSELSAASRPRGQIAADNLPTLSPQPQQVMARDDGFGWGGTVGLVRGEQADPYAEDVVRATLQRAGVSRVVATDGTDPGTATTVWLGDGDQALADLGVDPADDLVDEGYVLAAGQTDERRHVVLDGVDADGTFYAAQTLRQLVTGRQMPGVEVRDWPAMPYRGLIEGFYGTPWSHQDRLALMDHLGRHMMNTFEYAPKDDPYHRERWRDPYPADKLAELGELIDRAKANHVDFTFALSPGLSICYTSDADFQALIDKFEAIYDLGGRSFNIPLDDIDYNNWHCDSDVERFGTGPAAAGEAQAYILNRVQREWIEPKGDVAPLQMVPTEYYNVSESAYKRELREGLDPNVVVMWTGIGVIPQTITVAQAEQARQVFGHEILVWDNYPVNDYIGGRLPLAPYSGRESGLSDPLIGIVSNPMNQASASEIALSSFGDFGWNDAAYDADASWRHATLEKAGSQPVAAALRTFADLSWLDTTLHREQSPQLAAEIDHFWARWDAGSHREAIAGLRSTLATYGAAVATVHDRMPDPRFLAETDAWLRAADLWLRAGDATLDLLTAQEADDGAEAWAARQRAETLITDAKAIRADKAPHSGTYPRIADGVLDRFIDRVFGMQGDALGVRQSRPTPTTTMGTWDVNDPARMVDGNLDTFYWSNRAPNAGDAIGVDLGDAYDIGQIDVLMSKPTSPNDFVHNGVLETSVDGQTWQQVATTSTAEVHADATGTTARYVRLRALDGNGGFWVVAREFAVAIDDPDYVRYDVTGGPAPASGSALANAADGLLDTTYVAGAAPANGDALVVTASSVRPVQRVIVLQRGDPAAATVEVRTADGAWQPIGSVDATYAELDADGSPIDAVRLTWAAGAPAPQVAEIILSEVD